MLQARCFRAQRVHVPCNHELPGSWVAPHLPGNEAPMTRPLGKELELAQKVQSQADELGADLAFAGQSCCPARLPSQRALE